MDKKTSEAQKNAVKRYREKNKEKTRIDNYRRTSRLFIKNHASIEDIEELESLISERKNKFKSDFEVIEE